MAMDRRDICFIYDSVWAGMYADFKPFYDESDPKMDPEDILEICRYAFSKYLRWSPDVIHTYMTEDILKRMKLYSLVMKVYPFPNELSDSMKLQYLIGMLYPKYYHFDKAESTEETFAELVEQKQDKAPKGFFANTEEGKKRAKICFRYMINHYKIFSTREDIFRYFNTVEGRKYLAAVKLKQSAKNFGTMADLIYESLNDLGMSKEEHEECLLLKEKYKSRYYMDRYIRKVKKIRREERRQEAACSD